LSGKGQRLLDLPRPLDPHGPPTRLILNSAVPLRRPGVFEGYPKESDVAQLNGDDFVLIIELSKGNDLGEVVKQIRSSDTWNIFTAIYCTEKKWDSARVYETLRVRRTDIYYSHFKSVESHSSPTFRHQHGTIQIPPPILPRRGAQLAFFRSSLRPYIPSSCGNRHLDSTLQRPPRRCLALLLSNRG
jgi:hypothetical protein